MRRAIFICCLIVLAWTAPIRTAPAWGAPPKLNYLYPAGAQRGQSNKVTANGSWDSWPVAVWVDRPGLQFTAEADKGQLKVQVDPNAEPGVYWLRLTNAEGATSLKPFVVGTLPELIEQEPNDDPVKPLVLEHSAVVNGRLGKREDVDTIAIRLQKGQTLVAALQANSELGSAMDAVLQVCSPERFVLEQSDDERGLDPLLAFTAPADGLYLVRSFGFPATPDSSISFAGNDAYIYRLTVTTGGFVDHTLPLAVPRGESTEVELVGWNIPEGARRVTVAPMEQEFVLAFHSDVASSVLLPVVPHASIVALPDSGRDKPQSLTIPSTVTGVIESPRDEDVFTFVAKKDQSIAIQVESDELGYLLDGGLSITDAAGKVLAEADDNRRARDPQLDFSPPADGEYRVIIQDVHGHGALRYVYRLTLQESKPDFELKLATDNYVVPRGGNLEIPVTVDRGRRFEQEFEIAAIDLPAGVTAMGVKSLAKGDSAKSVKLVLQASAEAQSGTFQVLGKTAGPSTFERRASVGDGDSPNRSTRAWLTITPAK